MVVSKSAENIVYIYTDGACSGNPGPGGWAALLKWQDKEKILTGCARETTNNIMELTAAVEALEALKRPISIILFTDSKYLQNGILSWMENWKKNGWQTANKKPVKNQEIWQRLDIMNQKHNIDWQWVKGHSGHAENERVDKLARQALEEAR